MSDTTENTLATWRTAGHIRGIDEAVGRAIFSLYPQVDPVIPLVSAIVSRHTADGHVALELRDLDFLSRDEQSPSGWLQSVGLTELTQRLKDNVVTSPEGTSPLVFVDGAIPRVYLRRLYRAQEQLRRHIRSRLTTPEDAVNPVQIRNHSDLLFPEHSGRTDWQRVAAVMAAGHPLTIITGGPGTGKTTTVLRLLALAVALAEDSDGRQPLRIALAAPTGKAAIRMEEAIRLGTDRIPPQYRHGLPSDVTTVHRLLGVSPHMAGARYNSGNPLPVDLVVVDEASMINLELMTMLFDALPVAAQIVLLGDRDQLAAVESGAVLADLCRNSDSGGYRDETVRLVKSLSGEEIPAHLIESTGSDLAQSIFVLRESYRFHDDSTIATLATAIRAGDKEQVSGLLEHADEDGDVQVISAVQDLRKLVRSVAGRGYEGFLRALAGADAPVEPSLVYRAFASFRVLSPLRRGPWGTEALNRTIEELIGSGTTWYHGRPVIVTRNDYTTGLMNGDTGIALSSEDGLKVYFPDSSSQQMKGYAISVLPPIETAFCLTVHKSQGSEFDNLLLIVPDQPSPVITRELLYTAITRARKSVTILEGSREVFLSGVDNPFRRGSALSEGW